MAKAFKVVGVVSSAREGSFSAGMVKAAIDAVRATCIETEIIMLPEKKIGFCTGCLKCLMAGECWQNDDFKAVKKLMTQAGGIIWGAPVYGGTPNAIMKNLIDRLGMLEVTTSSLGGKYMAGIAAAKSARTAKRVAKELSRFGINGTFARSYSSGYLGEGFSKGRRLDGKALAKARNLGARLARDIMSRKRYALQGLPRRILSSLIMKPAFCSYILSNREGEAKALYENLKARGLLA